MSVTTCIGCGCDDLHACDAGCSWLRVDRDTGIGVCSECPDQVTTFDAGKRDLSADARFEVEFREVFGN